MKYLLSLLLVLTCATAPAQPRALADLHYGDDARLRMDVYLPAQPGSGAPVIFMVHGRAWVMGDKASRGVYESKLARWLPRGLVLVSVNYRMLPQADPLEQARDVARALAWA